MLGGKQKQTQGYTIVEVMIFLAISSVMFLFAAQFINGKQAQADFRQSMNDINTQIVSFINDVANGEYAPLGSNQCSATSGSAPVISTGSSAQGANGGATGCIFLGKVLQFDPNGDTHNFAVYTIAARQMDSTTGDPVQTFAAALPIAVDTSVVGPSTANLTVFRPLNRGLTLYKSLACTAGCSTGAPTYQDLGAFGFFGSFGGYISGATNNVSGAQTIITAMVPNSTSGETQAQMVQTINTNLKTTTGANVIASSRYILLCFKNGSRNGSVTIGGLNQQQLTTDLELGNGVPAVCLS